MIIIKIFIVSLDDYEYHEIVGVYSSYKLAHAKQKLIKKETGDHANIESHEVLNEI
jgi:hypothetical protein